MPQIANTLILQRIASEGDFLPELDPDGNHVLSMHALHRQDTEVRSVWLVKLPGSDEPQRVTLSTPLAIWNEVSQTFVNFDA